jgi:hypothetical protein
MAKAWARPATLGLDPGLGPGWAGCPGDRPANGERREARRSRLAPGSQRRRPEQPAPGPAVRWRDGREWSPVGRPGDPRGTGDRHLGLRREAAWRDARVEPARRLPSQNHSDGWSPGGDQTAASCPVPGGTPRQRAPPPRRPGGRCRPAGRPGQSVWSCQAATASGAPIPGSHPVGESPLGRRRRADPPGRPMAARRWPRRPDDRRRLAAPWWPRQPDDRRRRQDGRRRQQDGRPRPDGWGRPDAEVRRLPAVPL